MGDIEKAVTEKAEACERHLSDEYTWMKHRYDYNASPHFSDGYVASEVRMLMRDQLNHEAVVTTAANRICRLAIENARLQSQLAEALEALKPFGIEAVSFDQSISDADRPVMAHEYDLEVDDEGDWVARDCLAPTLFTVGHLRKAAAVVEKHTEARDAI